MRHDLRWLDITDRIEFQVAVIMLAYRCLHGSAPEYLPIGVIHANFTPVSTRSSPLRSAQLVHPPARLSTYAGRSFTVCRQSIYLISLPTRSVIISG